MLGTRSRTLSFTRLQIAFVKNIDWTKRVKDGLSQLTLLMRSHSLFRKFSVPKDNRRILYGLNLVFQFDDLVHELVEDNTESL